MRRYTLSIAALVLAPACVSRPDAPDRPTAGDGGTLTDDAASDGAMPRVCAAVDGFSGTNVAPPCGTWATQETSPNGEFLRFGDVLTFQSLGGGRSSGSCLSRDFVDVESNPELHITERPDDAGIVVLFYLVFDNTNAGGVYIRGPSPTAPPQYVLASKTVTLPAVAYDATTVEWWRLRAVGTQMTADYATADKQWIETGMLVELPGAVDKLRVQFAINYVLSEPSGNVTFDDIDACL